MKKPFGKTLVGGILKGLVGETLQTLPFVGTIVTAFKEDTKENPKGSIKMSKWHLYRLAIGLLTGYLMYKGVNQEIIDFVLPILGV